MRENKGFNRYKASGIRLTVKFHFFHEVSFFYLLISAFCFGKKKINI